MKAKSKNTNSRNLKIAARNDINNIFICSRNITGRQGVTIQILPGLKMGRQLRRTLRLAVSNDINNICICIENIPIINIMLNRILNILALP